MRRTLAAAVLVALAVVVRAAASADDAAGGYAKVRPSLVKVWAFDAAGKPVESGSGFVIVSNASRSLVLSAAHVVAGAASIKIDIDRERHDLVAHVQQRGPRDLVVLAIERGGLVAATFAARMRTVVEGNLIAVAGYVKHDELIGVVGQEPRLLYPGTISSRPDNGAYLELENVHVEEGLSGGPVFDPDTGDVLGIVTSRTADQRGGFADSAALVIEPFLDASAIAFREREPGRVVAVRSTPAPRPVPSNARAFPMATPRPAALLAFVPAAFPTIAAGPRSWQASDVPARRIVYYHNGCAIVLSLTIEQLAFGASATNARLALRIGRRVAPVAACNAIAESAPATIAYAAAASSYDGKHLTIRFRYDGAGDETLFPADVSLDADLDGAPVVAHVQFIDADWDDTLDVSASRAR